MKTKAIFSSVGLWHYLKKHESVLADMKYVTAYCIKKRFGFEGSPHYALDTESHSDVEIEFETKVFIRLMKILEIIPESPVVLTFDENNTMLSIDAIVG